MNHHQAIRTTALAATFLVSVPAAADPAPPRVWMWGAWDGTQSQPADFIQMVRFKISDSAYDTPLEAAKETARLIGPNGLDLATGEVCILLQNFGAGCTFSTSGPDILFVNPTDGISTADIDCGSDTTCRKYNTPFMAQGVLDTGAWADDYVDKLEIELDAASLARPTRFHMDTEGVPGAHYCDSPDLWDDIVLDSRYSAETIEGWAATLSTLSLTSPDTSTSDDWFHSANQAWAKEYTELCTQAADGAMASAFYDYVWAMRDSSDWPDVKVSNYNTSMRFDGVDGRMMEATFEPDWYKFPYVGSADLQAWPNYPVKASYTDDILGLGSEDCTKIGEATVARSRRIADHAIHSSFTQTDPTHEDELVPWITIPHRRHTGPDYDDGTIGAVDGEVTLTSGTWPSWADCSDLTAGGQTYEVLIRIDDDTLELVDDTVDITSGASYLLEQAYDWSMDDFRAQMAVFRSRNIEEYILWWGSILQPAVEAGHDDASDVVDQVWRFTPLSKSVVTGDDTGSALSDLDFALLDYYSIDSASSGGSHRIRVDVTLDSTDATAPTSWDVIIEAMLNDAGSTPTSVTLNVYLEDDGGAFDSIGSFTIDDDERTRKTLNVSTGGADYIDGSGNVTVSIRAAANSAFQVDIDSIQVVPADN